MRFPDLLASRRGRLATFFLLYITEGIPLGYAGVCLVAQLRKLESTAEAIGAFTAAIYLPWAFKWLVGPVVDVLSSDRFGRRRVWILAMQLGMIATLLALQAVGLTASIALLTGLVIAHNVFAATQDVAIDALAVNVLREDERGMAGGLTFAGQYLGQSIGGAGALFLATYVGFGNTYLFVIGAIAAVTVLVVLPMREPTFERVIAVGTGLQRIGGELAAFTRDAWQAVTSSRASMIGLGFAVLPAGAMALGLALAQTLAVDIGFSEATLASWNLWTTLLQGAGCIAGGWLSDRLGRRAALAGFIAAMTPATLWLAWSLSSAGWVHPIPGDQRVGVVVPSSVVAAFWLSSLIYSLANGMMYGARAALFMDISNPRVAATQFTAYMALMNLGISYSARWQGWSVDRYGYPATLMLDAGIGLVCLAALAAMGPVTGRRKTVGSPKIA